jgi:hypothetical protein
MSRSLAGEKTWAYENVIKIVIRKEIAQREHEGLALASLKIQQGILRDWTLGPGSTGMGLLQIRQGTPKRSRLVGFPVI